MGPRRLNTARFLSGSSCRKPSTVQATFACSLSMRGKEVWITSRFSRAQNALIYAQVGREETMMIERFGEEYRAYMKRTWRFCPGSRSQMNRSTLHPVLFLFAHLFAIGCLNLLLLFRYVFISFISIRYRTVSGMFLGPS